MKKEGVLLFPSGGGDVMDRQTQVHHATSLPPRLSPNLPLRTVVTQRPARQGCHPTSLPAQLSRNLPPGKVVTQPPSPRRSHPTSLPAPFSPNLPPSAVCNILSTFSYIKLLYRQHFVYFLVQYSKLLYRPTSNAIAFFVQYVILFGIIN